MFWGSSETVSRLFSADRIKSVSSYPLSEAIRSNPDSTVLQSFIEHALSVALCLDKPLMLRKKGRSYFAVVAHEEIGDPRLDALKEAVRFRNSIGTIVGKIPGKANTFWAEALKMKVDLRDGKWWLLVEPDIWVSPLSERENVIDFLRDKKLRRYNGQAFNILNAWINLLCGSVGYGDNIIFAKCYGKTDYPAQFGVNTRTAYSRRGGANG